MVDLKLPRLPERTPLKLTIAVLPDLKRALDAYAAAYEDAYGQAEEVTDLIPYMLQAFLDSDRQFNKTRR